MSKLSSTCHLAENKNKLANRNSQTDRQTKRQTDRQTGRQTERQAVKMMSFRTPPTNVVGPHKKTPALS